MKALRLSMIVSGLFAVGLATTQAFGQANPHLADAVLQQAIAAEEQASNSEGVDAGAEAARLHLESAKLRSADDPQAVASIRKAAMYLAYSHPERAADLMVEAAEKALGMGDVVGSANSYIDAAAMLLSSANHRVTVTDFAQAQSWLSQAATLATSAELSDAQRAMIFRRTGMEQGHYAG